MNKKELATTQVRGGRIELWIKRQDKSRYYLASRWSAHRLETYIREHISAIRISIFNNTELVVWLYEHNR